MQSSIYRLEIIAKLIRENLDFLYDSEGTNERIKEEFQKEAIKLTDLRYSYLSCFSSLVKMMTLKFILEEYPNMNYVTHCDSIDHVEGVYKFSIMDFSNILRKVDLTHLKKILLNELNYYLIRTGTKLTYVYSFDLKLNSKKDLEVTIKTNKKSK